MQRTITVTNGSGSTALAQYRTVCLTLDHATLVSSRRSRADARDIFVSKDAIRRPVHVRYPNTSATEVYWSLESSIAALGNDTYTLHIGELDRFRDQHPIPMRSLSQWDIEQVTPAYRTIARNQPFAYYDGFQDDFDGQTLSAMATAPGTPSTTLYDPVLASSWGQAAIGSVTAASGSGNLSLTWRNFNSTDPVRVRCTATLQAGFSTPLGAGAICKANSGALTGFTAGVGTTANSGFTGQVTSGTFGATSAVALNRFLTDQTFSVEVAYAAKTIYGIVDGKTVPSFIDAAHAARTLAGVWASIPGASGGIAFSEAWAEVWDGVLDSSVTVSVASLAATMPCSAFPLQETLIKPATASPPPVVLTQEIGPQFINRYSLEWPTMTRDDYWELQALWYAQKGGAGTFSWTPPLGTAETYRFVPGSLQLQKNSPRHYAAAVQVERIVQ